MSLSTVFCSYKLITACLFKYWSLYRWFDMHHVKSDLRASVWLIFKTKWHFKASAKMAVDFHLKVVGPWSQKETAKCFFESFCVRLFSPVLEKITFNTKKAIAFIRTANTITVSKSLVASACNRSVFLNVLLLHCWSCGFDNICQHDSRESEKNSLLHTDLH